MSELSKKTKDKIDLLCERFPEDRKRSAVIGALHLVQHENKGYLTAELMNEVADHLALPTMHVYEVATFLVLCLKLGCPLSLFLPFYGDFDC